MILRVPKNTADREVACAVSLQASRSSVATIHQDRDGAHPQNPGKEKEETEKRKNKKSKSKESSNNINNKKKCV